MIRQSTILALPIAIGALVGCGDKAPQPYGAVPTASQLAWQQMETNLFVHFGPNTFSDSEWGSGEEDVNLFAPSALDCSQWAAIAHRAGMGGVILTAKHHDGFCLWPNPASNHTVAQSTWRDGKGDVLRELSDACQAEGIKFGIYISPWDRNDPHYGTDSYNEIFEQTLESALKNYGEVFEQWFDGACGEGPNGKRQRYDWARYHAAVYRLQPQAVIFSDVGPGCRWIGNEEGMAGRTCWSRLDTTGFAPGKSPALDTLNCGNAHGEAWVPGEVDVSIRPGWFYRAAEDHQLKSVAELLKIYYASVGRNSLLLLNVPADRRGRIPAGDSLRLMEFRSALDRIFATDCAQGGAVEASSTWHHNPRYEVSHLLDDTYDNYWAANETDTTAVITLRLDEPRTFNRILLQEYIPLGQRVARFHVDALDDKGEWQELARETTIGYKRILLCEPTQTTALRISIDEAFAPPILNRLALYYDDVVLDDPYAERDKRGYIRFTSPGATAQIRYTLDGTTPTATSQLYSKPIYQPAPCRLRAVAFDGQKSSGVVHYDWDVTPASFRVLNPSSAEAIVDGLSDDGADSLTRGAVLATAQPVVVDLAKTYTLTGFYYEPLLRGRYGCLQSYDLSCSNDGTTWREVLVDASFDNIVNSPTRREVRFDTTIRCRYLRLMPRTTTGGEQYGMGEIGIRTK